MADDTPGSSHIGTPDGQGVATPPEYGPDGQLLTGSAAMEQYLGQQLKAGNPAVLSQWQSTLAPAGWTIGADGNVQPPSPSWVDEHPWIWLAIGATGGLAGGALAGGAAAADAGAGGADAAGVGLGETGATTGLTSGTGLPGAVAGAAGDAATPSTLGAVTSAARPRRTSRTGRWTLVRRGR